MLLFAAAIPFGISCALLYTAGVFKTFWFWTFVYGAEYVTENSLSHAPVLLIKSAPPVIKYWVGVWVIAGIGFTMALWNRSMQSTRAFIAGITLFSFLTVCPGFYFRNHYFVTMLPVVALLAGIATSATTRWILSRGFMRAAKAIPSLAIAAALIFPIIQYREFFFTAAPARASQILYGLSPFPDSAEVAEYIKMHTTMDNRIAVFGCDRRSASMPAENPQPDIYTCTLSWNRKFSPERCNRM